MSELEFMIHFGNNLKDRIDDFRITQKDLAIDTGISEATISYYISAERMPSVKNLVNIAHSLYCEVSDLIPRNVYID